MRRLEERRHPITREHLAKAMARLDVVYPQNRDPAQTALRYQAFFDVLKSLSIEQLERAVDRYLRSDERFGPAPGQLLSLAHGADTAAIMEALQQLARPE